MYSKYSTVLIYYSVKYNIKEAGRGLFLRNKSAQPATLTSWYSLLDITVYLYCTDYYIVQFAILCNVQYSVLYSVQYNVHEAGRIFFFKEEVNFTSHFNLFVHYSMQYSTKYIIQCTKEYCIHHSIQFSVNNKLFSERKLHKIEQLKSCPEAINSLY